jgi:hypothetical protein
LWDEDLNYLKTEVLNPELNGIAYNISSDGEDFVVTGFVNLNFNSQVFLSRYSIEEVFTVKEESLNIGFKAFPNPVITGTSLFVDIDIEWSNPMINLIDVNGKVWVQRNISGAVSNIDFPIPLFVPPGIYYVQISDKVKKVTQKIVVSR